MSHVFWQSHIALKANTILSFVRTNTESVIIFPLLVGHMGYKDLHLDQIGKNIVWILIFGFCCLIQNHLAYTKYKRVSTIFVIYPWKGSSLTGAISLLYLWLQMLSGKLFFCKGTLWAIIFFWLIISQWFPLGDGQEMYNYRLLFPGVIHRFSAIRP